MISYQFNSSVEVCWSTKFCVKMLFRIYFVPLIGMFEYMFIMPSDAKTEVVVSGVCFSSWINCAVFLMLYL